MGAVAFVFAGQGAQYPGMGQELYACSADARAVFALADSVRPGTSAQCFSGAKEELGKTENTQPCLYAADLAAAQALRERGVVPACVAGFSLGELPALAFAGAFSAEDGFRLTLRRAALMAEAAEKNPGSMAAVLKLSAEAVEALCLTFPGVYPVNYNCPGQTVVSGPRALLHEFSLAVQEKGGRALPLPVSSAFHSPYMKEAAELFYQELSSFCFCMPQLPVYANVTALPYAPPLAQTLARQIDSPVRFEQTLRNMAEAGVDTFVEAGPGKTLSGLIQKTLPGVRTYAVQDRAGLEEAVCALGKGPAPC